MGLHVVAAQIDTDVSLAANSDTLVPSQKATKAFVLANIGGALDATPTASSTSGVQSGGVFTALGTKQNTLVSGTSIKTINSVSILGSGDLALAPITSPTFLGIPAAPTAAANTNTTQIATTAFVLSNIPTAYFSTGQYSGTGTTSGDPLIIANLSGSVISSGTVNDLRLSSNVPLKNAANTFTVAQVFANITAADIAATNLTMQGGIISNNTSGSYSLYSNSGAKFFNNGQTAFGTNSMPASSIVSINSTTQGFLPPVMTTTQKNAISSPAEGLLVYDVTLHKLAIRTAAAWEVVSSS